MFLSWFLLFFQILVFMNVFHKTNVLSSPPPLIVQWLKMKKKKVSSPIHMFFLHMKDRQATQSLLLMAVTDQEKMSTAELWTVWCLSFHHCIPRQTSSHFKAHLIKNLLVSFIGNYNTNTGFSCTIKTPVRGSPLAPLKSMTHWYKQSPLASSVPYCCSCLHMRQFITYI